MIRTKVILAGVAALFVATPRVHAQSAGSVDCSILTAPAADHATMDHAAHAQITKECSARLPVSAGQAAYGAISEVVRMLKADPNTDWAKVNIEALRQHLIDMDDVTMHAAVAQRNVPGGVEMRVTGTGHTADAIRRMAVNHAKMLDRGDEYHASATPTPEGAIIAVTAKNSSDARTVARIRGLGFAGLLTEGDHHAAHHLALARGETSSHER